MHDTHSNTPYSKTKDNGPPLETVYLSLVSHKLKNLSKTSFEAVCAAAAENHTFLEINSIITLECKDGDPDGNSIDLDRHSISNLYSLKVVGLMPFSKGFASSSTNIILVDPLDDAINSGQDENLIQGLSNLQILGRCATACLALSIQDTSKYPYYLRAKVDEICRMVRLDQGHVTHDSFAVCSFEFLDLQGLVHGDWIWLSQASHNSSIVKKRLCQVFASEEVTHLNKYYGKHSLLHVNSMLLYNIISPLLDQGSINYASKTPKTLNLTMETLQVDANVLEEAQNAVTEVEFKRRASPSDGLYFDYACKSLTAALSSRRLWVGVGDVVRVDVDITKAHHERLLRMHIAVAPESMAKIDEIVQHVSGTTRTIPFYFSAVKVVESSRSSTGKDDGVADRTLGFIDPAVSKVTISPDVFIPSLPLEYPLEMLDYSSSTTPVEGISEKDSKTTVQHDFIDLITASLRPEFPMMPSILLLAPDSSSKTQTVDFVKTVALKTGMELVEIDCNLLVNETAAVISAVLESAVDKAQLCSPAIVILDRIDLVAGKSSSVVSIIKNSLQNVFAKLMKGRESIILVATASKESTHDMDAGILCVFQTTFNLTVPTQAERADMIHWITKSIRMEDRYMDHNAVAISTAGLGVDDLQASFANAASSCYDRACKVVARVEKDHGIPARDLYGLIGLSNQDLQQALGNARAHHSESIGAAKIPKVYWSDIGGLEHVKKTILETIQLPITHPGLFQTGAQKRSGVLLYGPPGTGKTLIAKAVATSLSLNFLSVKGPELLNMYIGESEHNVRRVFEKARDARPCIIFFDEMESVAPARGEKGDSGGVMDRIVSQLLAEIDGMSQGGNGDIFIIGATNRPDLLDPALLRPGRFDKLLYLGVCSDHKAQTSLLKALTKKMHLSGDFDLHMVAQKCPFNLTGADLYALCTDANLKAISRVIDVVDEQLEKWNNTGPHQGHPYPASMPYFLDHVCDPELYKVQVTFADFEDALAELTPSLGKQELERYERLREKFEGPAVKDQH